jgi:hypothetical protein
MAFASFARTSVLSPSARAPRRSGHHALHARPHVKRKLLFGARERIEARFQPPERSPANHCSQSPGRGGLRGSKMTLLVDIRAPSAAPQVIGRNFAVKTTRSAARRP